MPGGFTIASPGTVAEIGSFGDFARVNMDKTLSGTLSTARSSGGLGFVDYEENGHSIPFWCRRESGAALAYIYLPAFIQWKQKYAWALDRKDEITALVIDHFRTRFPASRVEWETEAIVALIRSEEPLAEQVGAASPG